MTHHPLHELLNTHQVGILTPQWANQIDDGRLRSIMWCKTKQIIISCFLKISSPPHVLLFLFKVTLTMALLSSIRLVPVRRPSSSKSVRTNASNLRRRNSWKSFTNYLRLPPTRKIGVLFTPKKSRNHNRCFQPMSPPLPPTMAPNRRKVLKVKNFRWKKAKMINMNRKIREK